MFATVSLAGAGTMPWGAGRVLAGVVFTLGLIIGGVVMVGAGYWFVYLRSRAGR